MHDPDFMTLALVQRQQYDRLIAGNLGREFRYWCKFLIDVPYTWGKENMFGTDCSGTVCWALLRMGYNIRTTADVLMKKVFTRTVLDEDAPRHYNQVRCVFYVDEDGKAIHATPVMGRYVVLDAGADGIRLETAIHVRQVFESNNKRALWRELDWGKASVLSESASESWDIDPMHDILNGVKIV